MTKEIDPYDDGLAIVLELDAAATELDLSMASELLDEWLEVYEGGEQRHYRNSGLVGSAGEKRLVLWADRITDDKGAAAARDRARTIAERAKNRMPVKSWHLDTAAIADDMAARLGTPVLEVRAGGDLVAQTRAKPTPRGLRPSLGPLAAVVVLRFLARGLELPLQHTVSSAIVLAGIAILAIASRHWCERREHLLAAGACAAFGVHVLAVTLGFEPEWLVRTLALVLAAAWAWLWLDRGKPR